MWGPLHLLSHISPNALVNSTSLKDMIHVVVKQTQTQNYLSFHPCLLEPIHRYLASLISYDFLLVSKGSPYSPASIAPRITKQKLLCPGFRFRISPQVTHTDRLYISPPSLNSKPTKQVGLLACCLPSGGSSPPEVNLLLLLLSFDW